jgi:aconitate hydratase
MITAQDVLPLYERFASACTHARKLLGHPLSLAEKILWAHRADPGGGAPRRGVDLVQLRPDRVAMQDATAQMALLQFMQSRRDRVAVPTTVHCDHLIQARVGAAEDMNSALKTNREVYDFLRSASARYGIGFWKPGAGIIHQVVLENYAFPGGLMIGTDSHTPNAGGLGMIAVGVGGADAVDVMAGLPWEVKYPKLVGVHLTGSLGGWTSAKDVILRVCELLTCAGGTNKIIEYFGPGTRSISATGKATITNMGAELGATTSIFPFDERSATYLRATRRDAVAAAAEKFAEFLRPDEGAVYDERLEIDLSALEPYVVGPHSPDLARPISRLAEDVRKNGYPDAIKVALIGSCTNSSYEDVGRAAHVARQALNAGLKARTGFLVTPGSDQIYSTMERDGQLEALRKIGGTVLANACGPCIGQWKREDVKPGTPNSILTSYNRNFKQRNDGSEATMAFIGSPEIVTALALAGRLSFNPLSDAIDGVRLAPPEAPELPARGFQFNDAGFIAPPADGRSQQVAIDPKSDRLQALDPFPPFEADDLVDLPVLLKAKGKCTTDHISPAGPWLKYRGHLDKISDNMFSAAVNAFSGAAGKAPDGRPLHQVARDYKARGAGWVAVGDANYGEGSSREHAAMSPRWLGARAVIVRSFARIHETNLKKQGVLPLTFADPSDYDRILDGDTITLHALRSLAPGKPVRATIRHRDGRIDSIELKHSLSTEQIAWFFAGSALNALPR